MLLLISLLSFLLPTQLGLHLNNLSTTVYGFNIDYLIPTIYLTDIVAFLVIVFGFQKISINKKNLAVIIGVGVLIVLNILNSLLYLPSIFKWLKLIEMFLLGLIILRTKNFKVFNHFVIPLSFSVVLISLLGIMQFLNKGSINGLFYFLGERRFIFLDPNVAPYPYSTFSHPNSFAGFLLVFQILFLKFKDRFNKKYFWLVTTLVVINLILTNSLNVYITIILLLATYFVKEKVLFGIVPIDIGARFITHRLELISASFQMIKENFLLGVGLNNFIPNLVKVSNSFVNSWELQPVHNIFLLVFAETGLIGFLGFCLFLINIIKNTAFPFALIAIVLTGMNDHYWLTLQQNMLLFVFVIIAAIKETKKHTV